QAVTIKLESVVIADDGLVINILGGDIHQSKRQRAFSRTDISRRNLVHAPGAVGQEIAPARSFVLVQAGFGNAAKILQRELRVHRNIPWWKKQQRIGNFTGGKTMLQGELLAREY